MNVNSLITKDYRKKDDFTVRKNKANSKPISEKPKMNVNLYVTKDYENVPIRRRGENKPNSNPIPLPPKPKRLPVLMNHGGNGNNTPKESLPQSYKISSPQKSPFLRKKPRFGVKLDFTINDT